MPGISIIQTILTLNTPVVDRGIGLHSGRLELEQLQFLDRVRIAIILAIGGYLKFETNERCLDNDRCRDSICQRCQHVQDCAAVPLFAHFSDARSPKRGLDLWWLDVPMDVCMRHRCVHPMSSPQHVVGALETGHMHQPVLDAAVYRHSEHHCRHWNSLSANSSRFATANEPGPANLGLVHVFARELCRFLQYIPVPDLFVLHERR